MVNTNTYKLDKQVYTTSQYGWWRNEQPKGDLYESMTEVEKIKSYNTSNDYMLVLTTISQWFWLAQTCTFLTIKSPNSIIGFSILEYSL